AVAARPFLCRREDTTALRVTTEQLKEVLADPPDNHVVEVVTAAKDHRWETERRDRLKCRGERSPGIELRVRRVRVHTFGRGRQKPDDARGIRKRQRPEQDRVEQRKNRGVRTDADRERQNADDG